MFKLSDLFRPKPKTAGIKMFNPTGGKVRNDSAGSGYFGSPRGDRTHEGLDFEVVVGQPVFAPFAGKIVRVAYPYSDTKEYSGVMGKNDKVMWKMFYFKPFDRVIGKVVEAGEKIGVAQDISQRYGGKKGGMTPHVHVEVKVDPLVLVGL